MFASHQTYHSRATFLKLRTRNMVMHYPRILTYVRHTEVHACPCTISRCLTFLYDVSLLREIRRPYFSIDSYNIYIYINVFCAFQMCSLCATTLGFYHDVRRHTSGGGGPTDSDDARLRASDLCSNSWRLKRTDLSACCASGAAHRSAASSESMRNAPPALRTSCGGTVLITSSHLEKKRIRLRNPSTHKL